MILKYSEIKSVIITVGNYFYSIIRKSSLFCNQNLDSTHFTQRKLPIFVANAGLYRGQYFKVQLKSKFSYFYSICLLPYLLLFIILLKWFRTSI